MLQRTSFVCLGSPGPADALIYQELPRKEGGEEFFLYFSPADHSQEELLRTLFRDAVSASRLGSPLQYFARFIERFRALVGSEDRPDEMLAGALIAVCIRRGPTVYLIRNREAVAKVWDGRTGAVGSPDSLPGIRELPLGAVGEQGDLFARRPEDCFHLCTFVVPPGAGTLVLAPSADFMERHAATLANSVFFPSFAMPKEIGLVMNVERSFPAFHWSGGAREEAEIPTGRRRLGGRVIAAAAAAAAAAVVLFAVIGAMRNGDRSEGRGEGRMLLAAQNGEKPAAPEAASVDRERADPRARSVSLVESWRAPFRAPVTSSPRISNGAIFFGCRDGALYAYTPEGELLWSRKTSAGIGATPWCGDGAVICANYAGEVACLSAKDGAIRWRYAARSKIVAAPQRLGNLVAVGTIDGRLIALSARDGSRLWEKKLGVSIWANPVIGAEFIVAATTDGAIYRLDHGGRVIWREAIGSGIRSNPLCIEREGLIVFGTKDGTVHARSLADGAAAWTVSTGGEVNGGAAFDGKAIYAGSGDGRLYAISLRGALLWKGRPVGAILSTPLVLDGVLFATTYSSRLVAVDSESGRLLREYRTASPVYSSPAADADRLYFGSNGGVFHALWIHTQRT